MIHTQLANIVHQGLLMQANVHVEHAMSLGTFVLRLLQLIKLDVNVRITL